MEETNRVLSDGDGLRDDLAVRPEEIDGIRQEIEAVYYAIAHNLRAPIRSIDSCSQTLLSESLDLLPSRSRDQLIDLQRAAGQMATLVDELLELSRVGRAAMHPESLDFSAMAKTILFDFQKAQPRRLGDFMIGPHIEARGDRPLMKIALGHLLGNAWKFSSKCLRTNIEFGLTDGGGVPAYFVRDHGAGFDMAQREKLFVPFQRLHPRREYPGNGVGLPIVQRIIHRHGGRIWVESHAGIGTTVFFTVSE